MTSETIVQIQVQKVIDLVIEKKNQREDEFLDTLIKRLYVLFKALNTSKLDEIIKNPGIKGALRAYFDTNIVESYEEPLVIELDKLEMMLSN
jgi:hypothetical protein